MYCTYVKDEFFTEKSPEELAKLINDRFGPDGDNSIIYQDVGTIQIGTSFVPYSEDERVVKPLTDENHAVEMARLTDLGSWHIVDTDKTRLYKTATGAKVPHVICGIHANTKRPNVKTAKSSDINNAQFCQKCARAANERYVNQYASVLKRVA